MGRAGLPAADARAGAPAVRQAGGNGGTDHRHRERPGVPMPEPVPAPARASAAARVGGDGICGGRGTGGKTTLLGGAAVPGAGIKPPPVRAANWQSWDRSGAPLLQEKRHQVAAVNVASRVMVLGQSGREVRQRGNGCGPVCGPSVMPARGTVDRAPPSAPPGFASRHTPSHRRRSARGLPSTVAPALVHRSTIPSGGDVPGCVQCISSTSICRSH